MYFLTLAISFSILLAMFKTGHSVLHKVNCIDTAKNRSLHYILNQAVSPVRLKSYSWCSKYSKVRVKLIGKVTNE